MPSRATQQGFLHHAALAQERLCDLHLDRHHATEPATAVREAIDLYAAWGVPAKLSALRARLDQI
jgi:hypothetical protein